MIKPFSLTGSLQVTPLTRTSSRRSQINSTTTAIRRDFRRMNNTTLTGPTGNTLLHSTHRRCPAIGHLLLLLTISLLKRPTIVAHIIDFCNRYNHFRVTLSDRKFDNFSNRQRERLLSYPLYWLSNLQAPLDVIKHGISYSAIFEWCSQ